MFDDSNLILYALLKGKIKQFVSKKDFPEQGSSGKIYIDMSTRIIYVWDKLTNNYIDVGGDLSNYYNKTEINEMLIAIWYEKNEECIYIRKGVQGAKKYSCYSLVTLEEWNTLKENNQLEDTRLYVLVDDNENNY